MNATEKHDFYIAGLQAWRDGDNERAEKFWLEAAEQATAENARQIADGLSGLALELWKEQNKSNEGERLFKFTLELRQKWLPENDLSKAMDYNNLGMICEERAQSDQAIEYLEKSVAIIDSHVSIDKADYANSYFSLAALLFRKKNLVRTIILCQKGLEIHEQTLGEHNPLTLMSLELKAKIQEATKAHCRDARETRKEFGRRVVLLAQECNRRGDHKFANFLMADLNSKQNFISDQTSAILAVLSTRFLKTTSTGPNPKV